VDKPAEIAFVVDCYRGRWIVEEFFKALKTGCQYERRQLESAHGVDPVPWSLSGLRVQAATRCLLS
jgi:hypothetical protein